ncbi:class III lanthionine synthetase LanKC [Bacillus paramobilis]|uniref:Class III lanthionine synthetase LanKC n=1 Tax=Bacillus paramobilis TaxID=2817477 RepID=A0ABZ2VL54_9BACI
MNKNHLYFKYLKPNSKYFEEGSSNHIDSTYKVLNLPDCCLVFNEDSSPWKFYSFRDQKIKDQGWKIHISSTIYNAQEILEEVSEILIERKIAFKHIINESTLHSVNSKNGNRISSGKFITIYPPSDEVFLELLNVLYEKIKNKENGPYILSDKCWKNSNIYYRYGGFRSIYNEKGEPCIKDESGHLIPDDRKPYYQVPKFVESFDQFLDSKNIFDKENDKEDRLKKYEFLEAFRYTNGGGIYLAERKEDKEKVVIKEARPKVGLDAQNKDAIERIQVEYDTLTQLTDVKGVVNVIDYFKSWKHIFLVEEYVEGLDLKTWISVKYPFHRKTDKEIYIADVKQIIFSLVNIVEGMHEKGIGMGDLQPSNVIIDEELNVKLIDFESANEAEIESKAAMQTMGFASFKNKNHKERDWYAVKKILRYCILPMGPVSTLADNSYLYQNEWIEREFGRDFYSFVRNIEKKCDEYLSETREKERNDVNKPYENFSEKISSIIDGLRKGVMENFVPEQGLIHGDIRQYEVTDGKYNVFTGGTGAALALFRSGNVDVEVFKWMENVLMNELDSITQQGLFTGEAGIAVALYELGYKREGLELFNRNIKKNSYNDVSLRSGLAGIGLAYISLYLEEKEDSYLKKAESIANSIKSYINENKSLTVSDWAAVPIGILDGWSGVSMFYAALYSVTKKKEFYILAKDVIERDLRNTQKDEKIGILQTKDDKNRLLPYLSGGSIGIGVAIWYLNHVSGQKFYQEELNLITNLNDIRCTFSGGLFDGIGGFLLLPLIMEEKIEGIEKDLMESVDKLNLFLIKEANALSFPGNFCYRLSDDMYSGSAGIILALNGILKSNPLHWLPIINVNSFVEKTGYKK